MKKIITLFLLIVTCLTMIVCVTGCSKKVDLNINDYLVVKTNGYDGYGTISITIDHEAMINKRAQELSLSEEERTTLLNVFKHYTPFTSVYESSDKMKNGDVVSVKWELDNQSVNALKDKLLVDFKTEKIDVTIDGFTELKEYDPFMDLSLTFNNSTSGSGDVVFKIETVIDDKNVTWDVSHNGQNGSLKNGDVLTLSIESDIDEELLAKNHGYKISSKTLEYTLTELCEYITDESLLKRLSQENHAAFDKVANDWIVSGLNDENNMASYRELERIGYVYYTNTQTGNASSESTLVAVYYVLDPIVEGGYYTYIALTDTFVYQKNNGIKVDDGVAFSDAFVNYDKETVRYSTTFGWRQGDENVGFICDDYVYAGHRDLNNLIAHINSIYGEKYTNCYIADALNRRIGG